MFPQFGAVTADSFSRAASSLVLRIGTDAHLYDDPDDVNIAALLDSRFDSEKREALKRLLALIAQGIDVCNFFPQVVKNVASQSLEVKKLVYLYLLHYAEKRPDEALLSINCFQKDLSDLNPLVRAWALRAMAGVHLHVVAPLVLAAIKKCSRDSSAYVRKCAVNALPKILDLLPEENTDLDELVDIFMSDHSLGVVGASSVAFKFICPNKFSLIGKNFRRLCEALPDVGEWGQICLIEIILRYIVARHGLVRDSIMLTSNATETFHSNCGLTGQSYTFDNHSSTVGDFSCDFKVNTLMLKNYIEGWEEYLLQPGCTNQNDVKDQNQPTTGVPTTNENDDVRIFLQCTLPLLWSQNSAVVLAAAGVHWILAPKDKVHSIVKPVLFLLRSFPASKYVVLCNILIFAKVLPSLFAPYYEEFFVHSSEVYQIKAMKLEILSTIATDASIQFILEVFQDYIKDLDRRFVADTVAAIGLCAQRLPSVVDTCLEGLLSLVSQESSTNIVGQLDREACILVQAIMSIRTIIKYNPAKHEKVIVRLACNLDVLKEPAARALIIWMVGEYCSIGQIIPKLIPTVLKYLAWSFTSEVPETKHQIINAAVKVLLTAKKEDILMFEKILNYILQLAKCDMDYDTRDRARTAEKLIFPCEAEDIPCKLQNRGIHGELLENMFTGKKHFVQSPDHDFQFYLPGSLSHVVLHAAPGYAPLPKPCSLYDIAQYEVADKDDTPDSAASGSSIVESDSYYDSEPSVINSGESDGNDLASDSLDQNCSASYLINDITGNRKKNSHCHSPHSDVAYDQITHPMKNLSMSISSDLANSTLRTAFEAWLDEQSDLPSAAEPSELSSTRISLNDLSFTVSRKFHMLLDPVNGNGLKVEYSFLSDAPKQSSFLVSIELLVSNCSNELLTGITMEEVDSNKGLESSSVQVLQKPESLSSTEEGPAIVPFEEIASLDPGRTDKRVLQVRFHHHLLPLKIAVLCNKKRHITKLWPDLGYFLRPFSMKIDAFVEKESELKGMFEVSKSCMFESHIEEFGREEQSSSGTDKILVVSRSLASKVLSHANVFLVSIDMPVSFGNDDDASGLCFRFSGEISRISKPCLISIVVIEGKCYEPVNVSVKINCEETVFGLNLLNKFVSFLQAAE